MKIVLLVVILLIWYIWWSTSTILTPTTVPAQTNLPSTQVIQTKLHEIGKLEILEAEYQIDYMATAQTIQLLKNDKKYKQILNSVVDRLTRDQIILTAHGKVVAWFDRNRAGRDMRQTGETLVLKATPEILYSTLNSVTVSQRNTGILKKIIWVDLALEEYARQEGLEHIVAQAKQDDIIAKTYVLGEQVLVKLFEVFGIKRVVILQE